MLAPSASSANSMWASRTTTGPAPALEPTTAGTWVLVWVICPAPQPASAMAPITALVTTAAPVGRKRWLRLTCWSFLGGRVVATHVCRIAAGDPLRAEQLASCYGRSAA